MASFVRAGLQAGRQAQAKFHLRRYEASQMMPAGGGCGLAFEKEGLRSISGSDSNTDGGCLGAEPRAEPHGGARKRWICARSRGVVRLDGLPPFCAAHAIRSGMKEA
jgi:hypothetical protein